MFGPKDLMVREVWQRTLERDESFVVRADEQTCFVVRRATSEDQLVGYISALTARGDMHWKEEIRKRSATQFDPSLVEPLALLVNELQPR